MDRTDWWRHLDPVLTAPLRETWIPVGSPGFAGPDKARWGRLLDEQFAPDGWRAVRSRNAVTRRRHDHRVRRRVHRVSPGGLVEERRPQRGRGTGQDRRGAADGVGQAPARRRVWRAYLGAHRLGNPREPRAHADRRSTNSSRSRGVSTVPVDPLTVGQRTKRSRWRPRDPAVRRSTGRAGRASRAGSARRSLTVGHRDGAVRSPVSMRRENR